MENLENLHSELLSQNVEVDAEGSLTNRLCQLSRCFYPVGLLLSNISNFIKIRMSDQVLGPINNTECVMGSSVNTVYLQALLCLHCFH